VEHRRLHFQHQYYNYKSNPGHQYLHSDLVYNAVMQHHGLIAGYADAGTIGNVIGE
jgi:hypothetical protein